MPLETQLLSDLSENVTVDLDNCAQEPIHIPGLIQPHGLLLVLDPATLMIRQASDNAFELLGIAATELVGGPLEKLLGAAQSAHLRMVLRSDDLIRANPLKLKLPDRPDASVFDVLITVGDELVFEAEPTEDADVGDFKRFYQDIRDATVSLQATDSEETLCQVVAEKVREITGFDRAMVYRFDAHWNGQVLAESRRNGVASSYLGLHFPASDIPAQARRLYTISRIRCIPDVSYTPVSLVVAEGNVAASVETFEKTDKPDRPLDMSCAVLRSVSPIHLEYLQNIGVAATLTISLLYDGQLWGLIACHHYQPKLVSAERRLICSLIGQIIGSHLKTLGAGAELAYRMQTSALQGRFLELLTRSSSLNGLAEDPTSVLSFVDAQGAAIVYGTRCTLIGQTPGEAEIPGLIELLKRSLNRDTQNQDVPNQGVSNRGVSNRGVPNQAVPSRGVWVTDSLAESYPVAQKFKDAASGMMGAEISAERGDYLLWFQPELIRTVHWGGDPDKPVLIENGTARLHPRRSFELWKQAITLHSKGFKPGEVAAVIELKGAIGSLMASEEERATTLHQREQSLRASRDQADLASGAKSEFLANMSHEIRTPLTAILGYAHLLGELGINAPTPLEQADAIRAINENSGHLLSIVNDILDISKIEAGKMTIELQPCTLRKLATQIDSLMRERAQSKQLEFAIVFEGMIPERIQTDVTRFKQILLNLIGNAIKFTEKGSVHVTFRYRDDRLHGLPGNTAPTLQVEVADTGIGIDTKLQRNLFERFVQADTSMSRRFGGTGLGLTISRRLADLLGGGLVIVDSHPGKGTLIRLTIATGDMTGIALLPSGVIDAGPGALPGAALDERTPEVAEVNKLPRQSELAGSRILLAEDRADSRRLVAMMLRRAGAVVETAANGKTACDLVMTDLPRNGPFDVILMDMQMPEMDGYEATAHLRAHGYGAPIIALTAHAMSEDRDACLAAGCDDYITKPIDLEAFLDTIAGHLRVQRSLIR